MDSILAQELVDHIIGLLDDSPNAFRACALVSRSWVYSAQARIFRRIAFVSINLAENERRWVRLHEALDTSPHLIGHIHQLNVYTLDNRLSAETLFALCNFPFTHLGTVSVDYDGLALSTALALQQLLSLPTLRHLRIKCYHMEPTIFGRIWDRCSAGLRHLDVASYPGFSDASLFTQHFSSPVRLDSLQIDDTLDGWLTNSHFLFDLSHLKMLSVFNNTNVLLSPNFLPAHQTIEVLDLVVSSNQQMIDLSTFPRLSLLRISTYSREPWPSVLGTLSSIPLSNRIRTMTLCFNGAGPPKKLDSHLSSLPIHHPATVEFEMGPNQYARLILTLPQLSAQNVIRRLDYQQEWFKNITGTL
ncbi:hypothetical protein C8R44DRAFT_22453 [Mycena epipterygia]|nr:hypothetical protein C8R44DRAFT_22453 [Mycena epipterygia]